MRRVVLLVLAAGCHGAPADVDVDAPDVPGVDAPPIPADTIPCDAPQYWPLSIRSDRHPVLVHYRTDDEAAMAREVLGYLDTGWDVEVGRLGFRPPLDDTGHCGPDGALDVFLWRGLSESYVDVIGENDATPYDDEYVYLALDPWGPYGGDHLDVTTVHELNHTFQAADDWSDSAIVYEMTAQFVEDEVYDDDNEYVGEIADYQANPTWSVDHDDDYQTWYMYGAALYLRFVRDRYFTVNGAADASFVGDMWYRLRSPIDSEEPDFEDALDAILRARAGVGFVDSVVEFAKWRRYTGALADGAHLEEAASFPEPARAAHVRTTGGRVALSVMSLGTAYVDVEHQAGDPTAVDVSLSNPSTAVDWVVQALPGASDDGDRLDVASGPKRVSVSGVKTIAVTAVPTGANDPDTRSATARGVTLVITPL